MKTILVPISADDFGCSAIPHAQSLAEALGAKLIVSGIQPSPTPEATLGLNYTQPIDIEFLEEQAHQIRRHIQRSAPNVDVFVEQASGRPIWKTILDVAHNNQAQMIVMKTYKRTKFSHLFHNTISDEVVKHADIPVMLIHEEQPVLDWSGIRFVEHSVA